MPREFPFQFSTIASSCCSSSDTGESEFEINTCKFAAIKYLKSDKISESNQQQQLLQPRISDFFRDMVDPMFHIKSMKICQRAPQNLSNVTLHLDNVQAHNIDIDIGDRKVSTIITLHQVPSFIIEAFDRLEHQDAWSIEGIFRKEGNVNRIRNVMPVYFGCVPIPSECTIHDICTLIKRFFREIKPPIFEDKQRNLLKFAESLKESLKDNTSVDSIMMLIHSLPPSHVGTIGYLMRKLKMVSGYSAIHKMTVDNLATVFSPSLFRDESTSLQTGSTKKKKGSQENLLNLILTVNDLQTSLIKLLIQNSDLIGVPKNFYKATRKPSDLKRYDALNPHGVNKEFGMYRNKVSPRSTSENPVKRIPSHSSSSSSALTDFHQAAKKEESNKLNKRYSMKNEKKKDRQRSNSVVRLFSEVKNVFAGRRSSNAGILLSDSTHRFLDTIPSTPNRISMDPEPTPHTSPVQVAQLHQIERQSRNESPKCINPNSTKFPLRTPSGRRVCEVMRERTPVVRPPIPKWEEFMKDDEKKENGPIVVRRTSSKRHNNQDNLILSSSSHNKRPPTDISAISPVSYVSPTVKESRNSINRSRRHTAPVKKFLQRNKPNSVNTGLVEPKNRRSNTVVVNGSGETSIRRPRIVKRPSKRSNECIGSSNTDTDSDGEMNVEKSMSLFGLSPAGDNTEKGFVSRQRRLRHQKIRQSPKINFDSPMSTQNSSFDSCGIESTLLAENTLAETGIQATEAEVPTTDKFIKPALTPLSSISPKLPEKKSRNDHDFPDISMPSASDASTSDDYLIAKPVQVKVYDSPPPLPNIPPPFEIPRSVKLTSPIRSPSSNKDINVNMHILKSQEPKSPLKLMKSFDSNINAVSSNKEIHPSETTVVVADESRSYSKVPTTPKRQSSPSIVKFRKPMAKLNFGDDNMSPGFSNSKARTKNIIDSQSSNDLVIHDLQAYPSANISNRPSLAFFQKNNRGFRVFQFASLDKTLDSIPPSNRSSANDINDQFEFLKPIAPPASRTLIPGELRRSAVDSPMTKRTVIFENKALSNRQIASLKMPYNKKTMRSPKYLSPQRRIGLRRNFTSNRQGLFQAMSRLSITPDSASKLTKKKLIEQTKTPSPKLPPRRNIVSNASKKLMQKTSSIHFYTKSNNLFVVPETEINI